MPTPGSEEFYQWFESLEPGTPQYRKALRALAEANEGGDGQAGPPPRKPADSHPPSWYERDPTGYPDGESGDDEFDLEDFQIESVPELLSKDIRPPEPLITYDGRSLLHEGTSQLAAKPKIGKTNLVMNFGLAIASESGRALGKAEVQRHGRVLMLNLDGSRRGSYDRFQTMTANDPDGAPARFDILHGAFPEVGDGALDLLGDYCTEYPETELIIVDTLQHLRPTSDGRRNVYHEDYEFVHPIAELGRKTDTSILLVHHLNKIQNGDQLDKVSGSTGLTGAVENVMILDRARGETKAELSVRPREDREEDFDLEFDGQVQTWIVGDDVYEPKSQARQKIYDYLLEQGQGTLGNIAEAVGKSTDNVSKRLADMKENGAPIKKPQRGVYKLVSGAS
ncbi:AAA family ATPase [Salinibacter ruber]|uniref:Biotin operon repressor n=1 Tax=Salinibacter ruber TaxID=146919 RepID=A0AAW5PE14_9BACT|nr:AAA family ATPase [Salinibacter ruber]MCS4159492.1 biotin operon repressor [Salinibacter ruber]